MKKVDSREAILLSLRDTAPAVAWQSTSTAKVDSSFKAMDRHADKSARDDRKSSKSTPRTKAAVFCDDFASFQGAGAGILLSVNEQARAVESSKSAQKTTRERRQK